MFIRWKAENAIALANLLVALRGITGTGRLVTV